MYKVESVIYALIIHSNISKTYPKFKSNPHRRVSSILILTVIFRLSLLYLFFPNSFHYSIDITVTQLWNQPFPKHTGSLFFTDKIWYTCFWKYAHYCTKPDFTVNREISQNRPIWIFATFRTFEHGLWLIWTRNGTPSRFIIVRSRGWTISSDVRNGV